MSPEQVVIALVALVVGLATIPIAISIINTFGIYASVGERQEHVYTLFGKVLGSLNEPGLQVPIKQFGPRALLVPFFGRREIVSTRLRQHYLRGQMVNSEEGTPMGVGIWYEMEVNDPVAYLFANTNPEGSLQANVASSTISTLSNLEMDKMLEDRHSLSRTVRQTVSPLSEKWGYRLGSVYIRKVFFTDVQMVQNITDKVVKRLVQVTSAMKQDGDNRVGLIRSETAKSVSQKMAEASAMRPQFVGQVLNEIAKTDEEILEAELEVLEVEKLLQSGAEINVVPQGVSLMMNMNQDQTTPPRQRSRTES